MLSKERNKHIVKEFWGRNFHTIDITDPPENLFQDLVIYIKVTQ